MEEGLSQAGMQGAQPGQDEQMKQVLIQVIQMLQQGVSPEEIIKMGVPQELVEYAMQMAQQGGAQQVAAQPQEAMSNSGGLSQVGM